MKHPIDYKQNVSVCKPEIYEYVDRESISALLRAAFNQTIINLLTSHPLFGQKLSAFSEHVAVLQFTSKSSGWAKDTK